MSDGGLGTLFIQHLPKFDWQRIESGGTGGGVPDLNFCAEGSEGWIENKLISGNKINFETDQPGWISRRCRRGGRVFIAVRRQCAAGPRRGPADDSLRLYSGLDVMALATDPGGVHPLIIGLDGPPNWPWQQIGAILINTPFISFPRAPKSLR